MPGLNIGYGRLLRVSNNEQDLTAQENVLCAIVVEDQHLYINHGSTGSSRTSLY